MIAIVDYGAGNLNSVKKAFAYLGAEAVVTDQPRTVARASKMVLPGVGHFSSLEALNTTGLAETLLQSASGGNPFLGICLGMQWLFEGSTEAPEVPGLGALPGICDRFPSTVKSPHVGWNSLDISSNSRLLKNIPSNSFVYFTHSYRAPLSDASAASTEYGGTFAAAVERDNVMGVQFHPEKSGDAGLQMLRNFLSC